MCINCCFRAVSRGCRGNTLGVNVVIWADCRLALVHNVEHHITVPESIKVVNTDSSGVWQLLPGGDYLYPVTAVRQQPLSEGTHYSGPPGKPGTASGVGAGGFLASCLEINMEVRGTMNAECGLFLGSDREPQGFGEIVPVGTSSMK